MAQTTITVHPRTDNAVLRDDSSPRYPVRKPVITICQKYIVGTDFTSGNGLDIVLHGCKKVLFRAFFIEAGTVLTASESGSAPTITVATATSTTNIMAYIVYEV